MQNSKENFRDCLLYEHKLVHNASDTGREICRWFERFRNKDFSLDEE